MRHNLLGILNDKCSHYSMGDVNEVRQDCWKRKYKT